MWLILIGFWSSVCTCYSLGQDAFIKRSCWVVDYPDSLSFKTSSECETVRISPLPSSHPHPGLTYLLATPCGCFHLPAPGLLCAKIGPMSLLSLEGPSNAPLVPLSINQLLSQWCHITKYPKLSSSKNKHVFLSLPVLGDGSLLTPGWLAGPKLCSPIPGCRLRRQQNPGVLISQQIWEHKKAQ